MKAKGFTLVELVVVITIIGIMTTVGIVSYRNTLKESRDQKRIVNLQSIRSSLELYRSSQANSVYPTLLSLLPPAGFPLPLDPLTGVDTVYSYTPTNVNDGACDNSTTYCATYILTTNLETLGVMYEVTPNTERILQVGDIPTPTPVQM
ncbi:type II secretion system protein, partial [Candidatus Woesebacteria bacterium]|nr:type II secretion system protein [Candidatus Woesebacteria bacterium]